jgi:hypothetical protein
MHTHSLSLLRCLPSRLCVCWLQLSGARRPREEEPLALVAWVTSRLCLESSRMVSVRVPLLSLPRRALRNVIKLEWACFNFSIQMRIHYSKLKWRKQDCCRVNHFMIPAMSNTNKYTIYLMIPNRFCLRVSLYSIHLLSILRNYKMKHTDMQ